MKELFEEAKVELVRFNCPDVIVTSGSGAVEETDTEDVNIEG